jgi:hypothetical protein
MPSEALRIKKFFTEPEGSLVQSEEPIVGCYKNEKLHVKFVRPNSLMYISIPTNVVLLALY